MIRLEYTKAEEFFPRFDNKMLNLRVGEDIQVWGFKDMFFLRLFSGTLLHRWADTAEQIDREYTHQINEGGLTYLIRRTH